MNKKDFDDLYGDIYEDELLKHIEYVNNPDSLRKDIDKELINRDRSRLYEPSPDLFSYRMMKSKGFAEYPERLKNYIVSKNESDLVHRSFLPSIIDLEPNSQCNYRCIMCHVSEWEKGKRTDDMLLDDFKNFIDGNPHLTEVKLHGMGEPLLHKDYFKMIEYLVKRKIWVRTSTNASLFHIRDNAKKLIDSGVGEVQVSIDGATKDVYEKIRRKGKFDRVKDNCIKLNNYANSKERLYTRMWVVVQKLNRNQLIHFVELAGAMGFRRISFSFSLNDWGLSYWRDKNNKIQPDHYLSKEEEQELILVSKREGVEVTIWRQSSKYESTPGKYCPWVFNRPYISCDFKAVPCSMIGNPDVSNFGNAKIMSKVWNNEKYIKLRKQHIDGDIPQICKQCYVNKLDKKEDSIILETTI